MPKLLPTDYLPRFFQLDLEVGSEKAHPIAESLDSLGAELTHRAHEPLIGLWPSSFHHRFRDRYLKGFGLILESLNQEEREQLFFQFQEVLQLGRRVKSVDLISRVYFQDAKTCIGRNHDTESELSLVDREESNVLTVRLAKDISQDRIDEFVHNASLFCPEGLSLRVANPKKTALKQSLGLPIQFQLNERRL